MTLAHGQIIRHDKVTQYPARLVYEKGNLGIGTIHARMNIGGYIIIVATLKLSNSVFYSSILVLFFVAFLPYLPEGVAPKPSHILPRKRPTPV